MKAEAMILAGSVLLLMLLIFYPFVQAAPFPSFLSLIDTPNSYAGQAGKVATVNPTEDALIFADANGSGGDANYNCITAPDGNTFTCTVTFFADVNVATILNVEGILRLRNNVAIFNDANIGSNANDAGVIFTNQLDCTSTIYDCLNVSVNQKIFSAGGIAYQTFKNPPRAVVFGQSNIDTIWLFLSGASNGQIGMVALTADPAGSFQPSGAIHLYQFTSPDGDDVNAWRYRLTNKGSFEQIGAIQYGDFKAYGDVNLNNLTFVKNGNDFNITNEIKDGNVNLNVRNANGDLNTGITLFGGGRVAAPNLKRINAGGKLPLSWDMNYEIVVDTSTAAGKINIEDLNLHVDTSRISQLQPRTWIDAVWGGRGYGFVAEEIMPIFPELVVRDQTGTIMGIDYQTLSIYYAAETMKQKARADALEAKVDLFLNTYCLSHPFEPACIAINTGGVP